MPKLEICFIKSQTHTERTAACLRGCIIHWYRSVVTTISFNIWYHLVAGIGLLQTKCLMDHLTASLHSLSNGGIRVVGICLMIFVTSQNRQSWQTTMFSLFFILHYYCRNSCVQPDKERLSECSWKETAHLMKHKSRAHWIKHAHTNAASLIFFNAVPFSVWT